jgi:4'-phosphopantetheinyl transferase
MTAVTIRCAQIAALDWPSALPASVPALAGYRLRVSAWAPQLPELTRLLTDPECARAGRYLREADRQRFVLGRSALRTLLGAATGRPPHLLRLGTGPRRKPLLLDDPALHFNVAHAGDWVLIALGRYPVGVDVETLDPAFEYRELLDLHFSPAERADVGTGAAAQRRFFEYWTRKEALLKATGQGLLDALAQVPVRPGVQQVPATVLEGPVRDWTLHTFGIDERHVGALAAPTDAPAACWATLDPRPTSQAPPLPPGTGTGYPARNDT